MIEARIVEADDTFSKNLGVKLGFADLRSIRGATTGINLPGASRLAVTGNYQGVGEQTLQATATQQSFVPNTQFVNLPAASINGAVPASVGISLFSANANRFLNLELSALEADGKGKIISSPRVVTADQQPAVIEQGEEIPFQQATSSGATSIQFKKANLKLEVTPQITPDGNVILWSMSPKIRVALPSAPVLPSTPSMSKPMCRSRMGVLSSWAAFSLRPRSTLTSRCLCWATFRCWVVCSAAKAVPEIRLSC
jgi:type II secretory pathway component HofQ